MYSQLRIVLPAFVFSVSCLLARAASAAGPSPGEPQSAAGPPPTTPAGPPGQTAENHLRRAERARKARRWEEAADAYRAAWALDPRPEIAGELGVCEVALGSYRDAAEHLQISLDSAARLSEDQRRRFDEALERAEEKVASVAIGANPPDAEVWVDGRSLGAPRETYLIHLDPGPHTFRARLAGHDDAIATLDAMPGTTPMVPLVLQKHMPHPSAPPSVAPVRCRAGADCGGRVATTLRYLGFATTGTALALGAGFAFGAAALDAELEERIAGRARDACWSKGNLQPCRDLTELRNTRDLLAGGATLGFAAAGVVGAVTVSSFWWAPGPRRDARIRIAPAMSQRQLGATVHGHW